MAIPTRKWCSYCESGRRHRTGYAVVGQQNVHAWARTLKGARKAQALLSDYPPTTIVKLTDKGCKGANPHIRRCAVWTKKRR